MYLLHLKKNGIYANISLFLSYSEITVATRSSLYPDQMVTAVTRIQPVSRSNGGSTSRDDLYSPERQGRSGHLDEPQRQIPIEDLVTLTAIGTRPQEPDESFTQSNFAAVGIELLVRLARGELAPRLSLVSPKVFSLFCHRWSFGSLLLSPLACLVGYT